MVPHRASRRVGGGISGNRIRNFKNVEVTGTKKLQKNIVQLTVGYFLISFVAMFLKNELPDIYREKRIAVNQMKA